MQFRAYTRLKKCVTVLAALFITNNQRQRASLGPVDGAKDDWRQLGASYSF